MLLLCLALQDAAYVDDRFLFRADAGAIGRLSFPIGNVEDVDVTNAGEVIFLGEKLRYIDLFDPGVGLSLELDVMLSERARPGASLHMRPPLFGVYGALQLDRFDGDGDRDDNGNTIRPDDLRLLSGVAGLKVAGTVHEQHFGELRVGVGATRYEDVEARFTNTFGTTTRAELIDASTAFLMEFRLRYGYRWGPVAFLFGFGLRVNLGPDEGGGAGPTIDPGPLWLPDLELGVQLGF